MDRSILLLLSLTAVLFFSAAFAAVEDPIIRQVISGIEDQLPEADHHFASFKSKFGKSYATQEEHDYRFSVFKANLRRAKRHQAMDPDAVHGVTKFMDITPKEFRKQYLGMRKNKLRLPADANTAPILPTSDLPTDFDWRDHGAVGKVKDQICFHGGLVRGKHIPEWLLDFPEESMYTKEGFEGNAKGGEGELALWERFVSGSREVERANVWWIKDELENIKIKN